MGRRCAGRSLLLVGFWSDRLISRGNFAVAAILLRISAMMLLIVSTF